MREWGNLGQQKVKPPIGMTTDPRAKWDLALPLPALTSGYHLISQGGEPKARLKALPAL